MAKNFYFAWINAGVTFNAAVHNVVDEDIFSCKMNQTEGDFATLELVVKNPRIGLLNVSRKVWGMFSINIGTDLVPVLKPLFRGRLDGIPDNIQDVVVTLKFTARPTDFVAQKAALAATLRVSPFWDPIWLAPDKWDDDDAVLEAYSAFWHVDPVTHVVTISDILTPEDGTIDIGVGTAFYDGVTISKSAVPKRSIDVTATIPWEQSDAGSIDLTNSFLQAYAGSGGLGGLIDSFTFSGLSSSWPKAGSRIGDGWIVASGSLEDQSYLSSPEFKLPDYFATDAAPHAIPGGSIVFPPKITGREWGGVDGAGFDVTQEFVIVPIGYGRPQLAVTYAAKRQMAQVVHFTLSTNMQALDTLVGEDEHIELKLTANKVSDLTADASLPIGDLRARDFVHSTRGRAAIVYLILFARAHLIYAGRAVKGVFQCGLLDAINVTTRKGIVLHDNRIPGGQMSGKIIEYQFELDGSNGAALATVTIGSSVGYGGSHTTSAGDPTYVDVGYVDTPYQEYTNVITLLSTSDITYSLPQTVMFDDKLDFQRGLTRFNIVEELIITNTGSVQRPIIMAAVPGIGDSAAAQEVLRTIPTTISLKLTPMSGGPFAGTVEVVVSDLIIPKQIDLEAPSV